MVGGLQLVVLDYDGTVAPTFQRQEKWFKFYSDRHSKPWHFADMNGFLEFYNHHCAKQGGVQNVYDALGLPCDMNDKTHPVWPAYEEFKLQNPQTLYPGMKETIEKIWEMGQLNKDFTRNRRLHLAINTTNTWRSIHREMKEAGINQYFDAFITEEVLRRYHGADNPDALKKPSKVSLALMLGLLNVEGGLTLHVGDTRNDLRSSYKVMRLNPQMPETLITVGAAYGYEGRQVLEEGVEHENEIIHFDHIIDKPEELVEIVRKLI